MHMTGLKRFNQFRRNLKKFAVKNVQVDSRVGSAFYKSGKSTGMTDPMYGSGNAIKPAGDRPVEIQTALVAFVQERTGNPLLSHLVQHLSFRHALLKRPVRPLFDLVYIAVGSVGSFQQSLFFRSAEDLIEVMVQI